MLETMEKPQLRLLLDHFALIEDDREPWRVAYPLPDCMGKRNLPRSMLNF